ncbi:MAG: hypothetical protein ACD_2C00141G0012 [uncultured bacterium (gcode 4)]|uniref:DUF559 domain-containing protein n=1 Tax=uncultured bacterium (gcode 4) TaxID=1234023 RepID=K2H172_9BACT|nr:MAG: hypothetical protein ACD_2C00141G0012 [uncultured bacterium (gcode 4)]
MDKFTPEKRSEIMSKIRAKNTKIEITLRRAIYDEWIRWYRLHHRVHKIRWDLTFIGKRVIIFIDWCFWHWCPECFKAPKSRVEYWWPKIQTNMDRDIRNTAILEAEWWTVLKFWEHEIRKNLKSVVEEVKLALSEVQ